MPGEATPRIGRRRFQSPVTKKSPSGRHSIQTPPRTQQGRMSPRRPRAAPILPKISDSRPRRPAPASPEAQEVTQPPWMVQSRTTRDTPCTLCPARTLCPASQHAPARFRRFPTVPRTRFPRFPRTKIPNIAPIEETADPLGKKPRTPCPAHIFWRSEGGARCGRGGENPTETCTYLVTGPGSRHGLGAQPGTWSPRIPAMASSQGDVRPSPMAYPASGAAAAQNSLPPSRYPYEPTYGQTRALPLSSTTCSARTPPSTILRHRPPVTRPGGPRP
jgi:hypothetical protein